MPAQRGPTPPQGYGSPARTSTQLSLSAPAEVYRDPYAAQAHASEACGVQATAFRSWTWPPTGGPGDSAEPVPGLRAVLRGTGLSSYGSLVEVWCEALGAAFLAELSGEAELQALADELGTRGGLAATACQRLVRALRSAAKAAEGSSARTTKEDVADQKGISLGRETNGIIQQPQRDLLLSSRPGVTVDAGEDIGGFLHSETSLRPSHSCDPQQPTSHQQQEVGAKRW